MSGVAASAPCDSEIFARLRRPRRIWAVGAIHGERARLAQLHRQIAAHLDKGDRLVYLGGYLGHGPDVVGTLDELVAFRRLFLARRHAFGDSAPKGDRPLPRQRVHEADRRAALDAVD